MSSFYSDVDNRNVEDFLVGNLTPLLLIKDLENLNHPLFDILEKNFVSGIGVNGNRKVVFSKVIVY